MKHELLRKRELLERAEAVANVTLYYMKNCYNRKVSKELCDELTTHGYPTTYNKARWDRVTFNKCNQYCKDLLNQASRLG